MNEVGLNYDQIISILAIYESEWEHRNNTLWSQVFRFFYLSIFIMVLPNITNYLSISLPNIQPKLFPIVGIFSSTISLIFSLSYSKRLEAISETYKKVNNLLPSELQRIKLSDIKYGKYFMKRHTTIIPFIIYAISLIIGFTLIFAK